eukprot:CAMPEP_0185747956 /NCGR_PEP_ID=MMETSP1174-20130828/6604_1 /TAXON_ID=35687 /ORGANISM="Dictyocha speculum, Strain CCMP1381" /LENGTH=359 /DNA_ID=CAMNT_0028423395 /DNA_START=53 /DNA_END=1132 /DNA_ORIENTATION=-
MDHSSPWGRSADDVVSRKRDMHTQKLHKQRLQNVKSTIDTSQPMTANMRHLTNKEKSKKLAIDRQQTIDLENSKLVEKMAHILRGRSRKLCGEAPFQYDEKRIVQGGSVRTIASRLPARRRELEKIAAENQAIAARIRAQVPNYDHQEMAQHYSKSATYGKNMSRTQRREQRARRHETMLLMQDPADPYTTLKNLGVTSAPGGGRTSSYSAPEKQNTPSTQQGSTREGGGGSTVMTNTTSLSKLTTASEIRRQTAAERGYDLDRRVISSMSIPQKKKTARSRKNDKSSAASYGRFRFQMDHTGREIYPPSLPSMASGSIGSLDNRSQSMTPMLDMMMPRPVLEDEHDSNPVIGIDPACD